MDSDMNILAILSSPSVNIVHRFLFFLIITCFIQNIYARIFDIKKINRMTFRSQGNLLFIGRKKCSSYAIFPTTDRETCDFVKIVINDNMIPFRIMM